MPFVVPTFNLPVDIWTGIVPAGTAVPPPPGPPRVSVMGNLSPGRRVMIPFGGYQPGSVLQWVIELMLPAGTDVRDGSVALDAYDVLEVPAGSGRFYYTLSVDDVAKGFPNEYRLVMMSKMVHDVFGEFGAGAHWPTPIP